MPKVRFLIPASPTRAFFSQIAAFKASLGKLAWTSWEPEILVCLGGLSESGALDEWRPHLQGVTLICALDSDAEKNPFHYAQIDGLFRAPRLDADVFARMDADTLPVANLEDLLDHVVATNSIAGVMAHYTFPVWRGMTAREAWLRAAEGLISAPLEFRYSYSLTDTSMPEENRVAPFYLNDGAVFFPRGLFPEYAQRYLDLRPKLMERLPYPYFSGQIALALAVAEMRAPTCALPMRYNFPNDKLAEQKYPEELETAQIFHYLRTDEFDRQAIFADALNYERFLRASLSRWNSSFQSAVLRLLGPKYPFA